MEKRAVKNTEVKSSKLLATKSKPLGSRGRGWFPRADEGGNEAGNEAEMLGRIFRKRPHFMVKSAGFPLSFSCVQSCISSLCISGLNRALIVHLFARGGSDDLHIVN